jgi:hypothetical protein
MKARRWVPPSDPTKASLTPSPTAHHRRPHCRRTHRSWYHCPLRSQRRAPPRLSLVQTSRNGRIHPHGRRRFSTRLPIRPHSYDATRYDIGVGTLQGGQHMARRAVGEDLDHGEASPGGGSQVIGEGRERRGEGDGRRSGSKKRDRGRRVGQIFLS